MGASPQFRPARLRDYGAFETDISLCPTQEVCAVPKPETAQKQFIAYPACTARKNEDGKREWWRKGIKGKWVKLAGRLLLTSALLVVLARSISWTALSGALGTMNLSLVLVGLVVGAAGIVVSSYQWSCLLYAEHIRRDLASLINLYLVGIAFSHFLPTGMGGDAVKAVYVGRASHNIAGSASATVMSRVTGFFGMLLLVLPVALIWHAQLRGDLMLWFVLLSVGVGGTIALALGSAIWLPRLAKNSRSGRVPLSSALLLKVIHIGDALRLALMRPGFLSVATLLGVLFWIVACLNYYIYAYAMDVNVPLQFYCIAIPFISLLAALPITINGFGIREGAFVSVFSIVHVPASHALLLALVMDAQVLLFGVMGGAIHLFMGKGNVE